MKLAYLLTAIVPVLLYAEFDEEFDDASEDYSEELAMNGDSDEADDDTTDEMHESTPEEEPQVATSSPAAYPKVSRLGVRHIEANGVGYKEGYTTIEGFIAPCVDYFAVPFLDARVHIFNDGKPAVNAGLGVRTTGSRVYGANIYYDYRKTHRMHYNQVAGGLETLGESWDFRANGYFPVGKRKFFPAYKFKKFSGNHMLLTQKREVGMLGCNAEIGYHFDACANIPLYFAAGPYYFTGQGRNAIGGEARANVKFYEYFGLQVSGFYDSLFHGGVQGEVSLNYPFGPRQKSAGRSRAIAHRIGQPVDRNEIIVVNQKHKHTVAKDSLTGEPINFLFVDNLSHSLGTIESPYNNLITAISNSNPGDVIYVFPGDGTSNGLTGNNALKDNQRLLGSGVTHDFNTTKGIVTVPIQQVGLPALFENVGSPVVTFANNCEISGFQLTSIFDGGVFVNNVSNPSVNRNLIIGPGRAVEMDNITGTAIVSGNTCRSTDNGFIAPSALVFTSVQNLIVQDNRIEDVGSALGYHIGINVLGVTGATNQTFTATITDNVISLTSDVADVTAAGIFYHRAPQNNDIVNISNNQVFVSTPTATIGAIHVIEPGAPAGPLCINMTGNLVTQPAAVNAYAFVNSSGTAANMKLSTFSNNIGSPVSVTGTISTGPCE